MVDVREAAALASRSPETIRRWVWSGKVASIKYGTKLLVRRSDVAPSEVPTAGAGTTLAEWAATVAARAAADGGPTPGPSGRDLLLEDRYERGYGAGS